MMFIGVDKPWEHSITGEKSRLFSIKIEPWFVVQFGYFLQYDKTGLIIYLPKRPTHDRLGRLRSVIECFPFPKFRAWRA